MNTEMLVYRIEWNDKGPFYDETTYETVSKLCRKIAPEYKQYDNIAPTLFDHYCANAESPYDNKIMCRILDNEQFSPGEIGFGFVNIFQLGKSIGLCESLYVKQFVGLSKQDMFTIKCYSVNAIAATWNQAMFKWSSAELVKVFKREKIIDIVSKEFSLN